MNATLLTVLAVVLAVFVAVNDGEPAGLQAEFGGFSVSEQAQSEPSVHMGSFNWSVTGFSGQSWIGQLLPSSTFGFHAAEFHLNEATFSDVCCANNSTITVFHDPEDLVSLPPLTLPGFQPFSLPFSFTGHLPFAGGVDIAGDGILTVSRQNVDEVSYLTYRYAVPEASTVAGLALGFLTVLGAAALTRPRTV